MNIQIFGTKQSVYKGANPGKKMRVNKLMELDKQVSDKLRIESVNPIQKMKPEYKNKR